MPLTQTRIEVYLVQMAKCMQTMSKNSLLMELQGTLLGSCLNPFRQASFTRISVVSCSYSGEYNLLDALFNLSCS